MSEPAALAARAFSGHCILGPGRWLVHAPCSVLDRLKPRQIAVVDLDRPGLDEGAGLFLVCLAAAESTDPLVVYVAPADPLTRRGRLRREIRFGPIRYHVDDLGSKWWAWRLRQLLEVQDV